MRTRSGSNGAGSRGGSRWNGGNGGSRLASGLGLFSIALGAAQIAAPHKLTRLIGITKPRKVVGTMRALGVREIASGIGALSMPRHPAPMWTRVAGDVLDLALIGMAARRLRTDRQRLLATTAAVLGVTALDAYAGRRLAHRSRPIRRAVTIGRPRSEVYRFYRDFEQFPRFMRHVESVRALDDRRSQWVVRVPGGAKLEWEAEVVADRPDERIEWRSVDGSQVPNRGIVRFVDAASGKGTEVHVEMEFAVPTLAKLFAAPEAAGDMRRLKQVLETGEVVHSDASIGA